MLQCYKDEVKSGYPLFLGYYRDLDGFRTVVSVYGGIGLKS